MDFSDTNVSLELTQCQYNDVSLAPAEKKVPEKRLIEPFDSEIRIFKIIKLLDR